jgi:hypothetical protein
MTKLQTITALLLAFVTMLGLSACDTSAPAPAPAQNDCRVSTDHNSLDVLKGCPARVKNSVELKTT